MGARKVFRACFARSCFLNSLFRPNMLFRVSYTCCSDLNSGLVRFRKLPRLSTSCFNFLHMHKQRLVESKFIDWKVEPVVSSDKLGRERFNFVADVAEKVAPSIVFIEVETRHPFTNQFLPIRTGLGCIIKCDGLILTSAHAVANCTDVIVRLHDGRKFKGIVEAKNIDADLAVIKVNVEDLLPVLPFGQSSNVRPGEFVIAMGGTSGHCSVATGVVNLANRPSKELSLHHKNHYIQTDIAMNALNSGGLLINSGGAVIGINTMKIVEGITFATPSDVALQYLKEIQKKWSKGCKLFDREKVNDSSKANYIGIAMLTLTPDIVQQLQLLNPDLPYVDHGLLVGKVILGSSAYVNGIKPGDIIVQIHNRRVYSPSDVYRLLDYGGYSKIHVIRGSKALTLSLDGVLTLD